MIAVALSGGADSTLLLQEMWTANPNGLIAFHVNHQLQAAANDFEAHCRAFCSKRNIPFICERVNAKHATGQSPEEAARSARYVALAHMAKVQGVSKVLLAQHADDQAESVILAMSRGAGLKGLSGMAQSFKRHGVLFERPMLHRRSADIRAKLHELGIAYITDPTNADMAYTRNKIRLDVRPHLERAFPHWVDMVGRSSKHVAQAQDLLDELARIDLLHIGHPPQTQQLRALGQVSHNRLGNALRYWLMTQHQTTPSTAQLLELQKQIMAARTSGQKIRLKVGRGFVLRVLKGADALVGADSLDFVPS